MRPVSFLILAFVLAGGFLFWYYAGQPQISLANPALPANCSFFQPPVTYLPNGTAYSPVQCNGLWVTLIGGLGGGLVGSMLTIRPVFYRLKARRES